MSNMKNGFSTLNRWLGKKNKDKSNVPNGKLSKSNTNLSISTTNINDTSQLEYNRIAPLPAVTSNAPFEQTFRITVLLPKDQLYVSRLGARVPLSKLLELVCENKLLDANKYEFRNPVDPSQVYSCDLTIGAVGLSEVRLCHKTDPYTTFASSEEVMKLQRTSLIRDSLSSSEFSSHNSKHTTKTASPYSSSNSLNSMDSTGMNYTRTPLSLPAPTLPKTPQPKVVAAPPRKKRAAPRPPSQIAIPEKSALITENGNTEEVIEALKEQANIVVTGNKEKHHYASTPNLSSPVHDCNGNASPTVNGNVINHDDAHNNNNNNHLTNGHSSPDEHDSIQSISVEQRNARNLYTGSVQNLSTISTDSQVNTKLPEPSPRKRLQQIKKKAAPAAPGSRCNSMIIADDAISIASTTFSSPDTPSACETPTIEQSLTTTTTTSFSSSKNVSSAYLNGDQSDSPSTPETTPSPLARGTLNGSRTPKTSTPENEENHMRATPNVVPKPTPRSTSTTHLNVTPTEELSIEIGSPARRSTQAPTQQSNISKVLLNRTPTPEPRSFSSCEGIETTGRITPIDKCQDDDDCASKQADSGIGEPVPSPIPDSLPSETEIKSTFESSSDDDDMIKTYNFKLGKTIVKSTEESDLKSPKTIEDFNALQVTSGEVTPALSLAQTPIITETSSWNFQTPISPPPTFADRNSQSSFGGESPKVTITPSNTPTDVPITPKIKQRPVLNFEEFTGKVESHTEDDKVDHRSLRPMESFERCPQSPLPSPCTPLNEIIDELSTILNTEKGVDNLIKKVDEPHSIESAKPNTLTNFSITTLSSQQSVPKPTVISESKPCRASVEVTLNEDEKHFKKNTSTTTSNKSQIMNRSDSFHSTAPTVTARKGSLVAETSEKSTSGGGMNERSASYLSLTKLEPNLNRRSSSELSIGESPSLQSLEVIKTILNSRKASLTNGKDSKSPSPPQSPEVVISRPEIEAKPKSPEQRESKQQTETKELPKVYRYSGPPSINFSTWTERPKVKVAIKNEGDYIFGGKNAGAQNAAVTTADVEMRGSQTVPRSNHRAENSSTDTISLYTPPTKRMGIPEKEFHVPITVKPLKDVTVDQVEIREHKSVEQDSKVAPTSNSSRNFIQVSTNCTLPRSNSNRYTMPAKNVNVSTKPLTRTASITQLEANLQKSAKTPEEEKIAPFGQNTLRRTGLKEKILATEEIIKKESFYLCGDAKPNAGQCRENSEAQKSPFNSLKKTKPNTPQKPTTLSTTQNGTLHNSSGTTVSWNNLISQGSLKPRSTFTNGTTHHSSNEHQNHTFPSQNSLRSTKSLHSAKLELKLQNSNCMQNGVEEKSFTNGTTTPKSAPAVTNNNTSLPPPPPPALPSKAGLTVRSKSYSAATTPTSPDGRDQLLDSIRNFRRNELKKI